MKIISISGKKRAGKNTVANYISGMVLKRQGCIEDFAMGQDGSLNVLTEFADGSKDWGILDLCRKDEGFIESAEETIWPYVKNYSFADSLKRVSVELFGLKPESVYGNEEQRAAPTHLLWENMPGVVTPEKWHMYAISDYNDDEISPELGVCFHDPGPMSGREFLQFMGTEIGRKMYPPIWINSTLNKILREKSGYALLTDTRFPDEADAVRAAGGINIRLGRVTSDDQHESEIALDGYDKFDFFIDNQNQTLEETCEEVMAILFTRALV